MKTQRKRKICPKKEQILYILFCFDITFFKLREESNAISINDDHLHG